jgi:hypothetical protein
MARQRIESPYPRFSDVLSDLQASGQITRQRSAQLRRGNFTRLLAWMVRHPEVLISLYDDIMEQRNGEEQDT